MRTRTDWAAVREALYDLSQHPLYMGLVRGNADRSDAARAAAADDFAEEYLPAGALASYAEAVLMLERGRWVGAAGCDFNFEFDAGSVVAWRQTRARRGQRRVTRFPMRCVSLAQAAWWLAAKRDESVRSRRRMADYWKRQAERNKLKWAAEAAA
jgi:hypothetical protein